MEDKQSGQVKKALKGVHSQTDIEYDDFVNALYQNKNIQREQIRLQRHPKNYSMELKSNIKKTLNSVYYKMRVSEDFVNCYPHTNEEGKYL